jgi:hypothetical protein
MGSFGARKAPAIVGTWSYTYVTKDGSSLFPTGPNDSMILRKDGTFQYDLELANRHSKGNWKFKFGGKFPNDPVLKTRKPLGALRLTYSKDSSIRTFYITTLTDNTLEMYENGVFFGYKRRR